MAMYLSLVGRIFLATLFLLAGINKITGFDGTQGYMESMGVPSVLLPLVIVLQVGGALAIIVGLQTRVAAILLAGFCILAAIFFHLDFADNLQTAMFLKNFAIAGGFLVLAANGAGACSLDARRGATA